MPNWDEPIATRQAAWNAAASMLARPSAGAPNLVLAHRMALRQGFVLTREQARCADVSDRVIRSLLRRREWSNPRRGVLSVLPPQPDGSGAAIAAAAAQLVRQRSVISHTSTAAILGVPLLRRPQRPVLTIAPGGQCNSRDDIDIHAASLAADETIRWYGRNLTSPARTAIDIARSCGLRSGVVALDAVLHEGAATLDELERVVERQKGWPYSRVARRALELADGRSESVLETLVRVQLATAGVPTPTPQVWLETPHGSYRVDLLWPRQRVVLEVDGLEKYRGGWEALVAEKRRQEHLEQAGYRVIRVTWHELMDDPDAVVRRVVAALAR
jgi:very-short-patch-repair endonuclease